MLLKILFFKKILKLKYQINKNISILKCKFATCVPNLNIRQNLKGKMHLEVILL